MVKTKSTEQEEGGMGFKDKQKALDTLKYLDGRDIIYQYHVITSFVSRAKRTLQITRDEEKLTNLRDALKIFEDWLIDYKENNRGKENLAYLPIEIVKAYRSLAKKYGVWDDEFFRAYKDVKGDYKGLRAVKVPGADITWDIERNRRLKEIISKMKDKHIQWYETDVGDFRGLPTKDHTMCIVLAYSPDLKKLRTLEAQAREKFDEEEEDVDVDIEEERRASKRSRESSSSSSDSDNEPEKKCAKRSPECNFDYLTIDIMRAFKPLAEQYDIVDYSFLEIYESVNGNHEKLESVQATGTNVSWDAKRNIYLRDLVNRMKKDQIQWFDTESKFRDLPTAEHTRCIMWGYGNDVAKLKELIPTLSEKLEPAD